MKPTTLPGVYKKGERLYTECLEGRSLPNVYNERIICFKGKHYRSWNPYRSKLAAALLKKLSFPLTNSSTVLYLGAATGTTVSHVSDMVQQGTIFAIENSPLATRKLLELCKHRRNIIPICEDANHPERYKFLLPLSVDIVYQDISQRNQAEIFSENISAFLKPGGTAIIMVKARSIDISLPPGKVYEHVKENLIEHKLTITDSISLSPYEKDHSAITVCL
ncbi:MAG: fibrillarin-like rRNA/tRNA 2'-O-methyltransferase [Thermoplasmatota archaeon]